MTSSLVGSEMCIRDRRKRESLIRGQRCRGEGTKRGSKDMIFSRKTGDLGRGRETGSQPPQEREVVVVLVREDGKVMRHLPA
eukprot:3009498-Prorocentrum_lima.AAC.1